jgi:hypothetical protein
MSDHDTIELVRHLRAMARCEHEDMTVVVDAADEIERLRAGLKIIVDADGWWDAPSLARDLLAGKAVP